jgi:(1->4)-alpha-D-glucan 1-alpha-D-glucosylmutase
VPLEARGPAADHVIGFRRGDGVVAVAPRLARRLAATGGWRGTTLALPAGRWSDVLDGREHAGAVTLASLLDGPRVALLERVG